MNGELGHWKVGLIFVAACILIGVAVALLPSSSTQIETQRADFYDDVGGGNDSAVDAYTDRDQFKFGCEIDGRCTDQTASGGDEDFGGAVVGMLYDDFSDRLQLAGFDPVSVDPEQRCAEGSGFVSCDYDYPETSGCMGTGEAYCNYLWEKGSQLFNITTRDGEGGEVIEMSYIR